MFSVSAVACSEQKTPRSSSSLRIDSGTGQKGNAPHSSNRRRGTRTRQAATAAKLHARGYRSTPRITPLVGTPVPAVTSACSTPGVWLTAVPRTWRTPSATPFRPWM